MAYIIHVKELAEHVLSSLSSEHQLTLLDLEQYPMKVPFFIFQRFCYCHLVIIVIICYCEVADPFTKRRE